jgi:hypothetical protein
MKLKRSHKKTMRRRTRPRRAQAKPTLLGYAVNKAEACDKKGREVGEHINETVKREGCS